MDDDILRRKEKDMIHDLTVAAADNGRKHHSTKEWLGSRLHLRQCLFGRCNLVSVADNGQFPNSRSIIVEGGMEISKLETLISSHVQGGYIV